MNILKRILFGIMDPTPPQTKYCGDAQRHRGDTMAHDHAHDFLNSCIRAGYHLYVRGAYNNTAAARRMFNVNEATDSPEFFGGHIIAIRDPYTRQPYATCGMTDRGDGQGAMFSLFTIGDFTGTRDLIDRLNNTTQTARPVPVPVVPAFVRNPVPTATPAPVVPPMGKPEDLRAIGNRDDLKAWADANLWGNPQPVAPPQKPGLAEKIVQSKKFKKLTEAALRRSGEYLSGGGSPGLISADTRHSFGAGACNPKHSKERDAALIALALRHHQRPTNPFQ